MIRPVIITNSLGSNYTAKDRKLVFKLLFQPQRWKEGPELRELEKKVNGRLFMKGRQAIEEALRQIGVKSGNEVVVQAFTCVAVVEPILNLGAIPIYADVVSKSLNPSLENIKKVISDKTKVVILQHTLGYVNPENEEICEWCGKNKIAMIQDLAHMPRNAGSSNFIILSFSQDKVFDGISGGALIMSNVIPVENRFRTSAADSGMTKREIFKLLLYPLITYAIRATYCLGIGKVIHFAAKKMGLMNSPIYTPEGTALPNAFAALALQQFNRLDKIIEHRKKIALQYNELINNKFKIVDRNDIENGSNLRYPIWINNREELESELQKRNFYLLDHWYDSPVSPASPRGEPKWIEFSKVNYKIGLCSNAENLSKHIFNLPTHSNINPKKAKELARLVNSYGK